MILRNYENRLIAREMKRRGLDRARLDAALRRAVDSLDGCDYELSHRVILNAVCAYREGGAWLDVGGGCYLYHLILKNLGMEVSTVDLFFPESLRERFSRLGVTMIESDLYQFSPEPGRYDVVSSYECLEHLPHSPKKIIDGVARALKPGGHFVISVPNVARFEQRWRVLIGRTPHEKYAFYYHSGDYFIGHHREMTMDEVRYMMREAGLSLESLFTTDMTVHSMKKRSWLKNAVHRLNYRFLLTDAAMPPSLRKHVWARAVKPAA